MLRELQRGVMGVLLDGAPMLPPVVAPRGITPALALGIYAAQVRAHFINSLSGSFPAVQRLVGEDYFCRCAHGFHARHPSLSGDLQRAGTHFAQYLSELHGAGEHRYLGEVARLEWLIQETLQAADHEPLDLQRLGQVPPEDYDNLRFSVHPSARLFAAEFPCVSIWEANMGGEAQPATLDLDGGPDRVLLIRGQGRLQVLRLSPGELGFLQSVQAGERFCAAIDAGVRGADAAVFDAAAALRRFVAARVIVDFQ